MFTVVGIVLLIVPSRTQMPSRDQLQQLEFEIPGAEARNAAVAEEAKPGSIPWRGLQPAEGGSERTKTHRLKPAPPVTTASSSPSFSP
jgi:hypothetical protein